MFLKKKRCWGSKTKIRHSKNAYIYWRFWTILMRSMVEERCRTFKMWILARTCDKNEPPMDPDKDVVLSKVDFFGGHSNILKSAESRKWTALGFYWRTRGRRREAKPSHLKQLIRFIARTPCCKQLFGEWKTLLSCVSRVVKRFLTYLCPKLSNATIINANHLRARKRHYYKRKCTSEAQTLIY